MIELVYLNPNISKSDADKLVEEGQAIRKSMVETIFQNMESIEDGGAKARYLSSVVPFLCMI